MSRLMRAVSATLFICITALGLSCEYAAAGAAAPPPLPPPPVAPPPPAPPLAVAPPTVASGSNSTSADSWLAGAHAGYNWQRGATVYGFEADLSATDLKSRTSGGHPFPAVVEPGDAANTTGLIDWYGTLRGRLGFSTGPALFYGTAGLAYGNASLNSNFTTAGLSLHSQTSPLRAGWVVGGGIEYLLRPDLSLNFGYQYVDIGTVSLTSSAVSELGVRIGQSASAHAQFQVATVGFSWHFRANGIASGAVGRPLCRRPHRRSMGQSDRRQLQRVRAVSVESDRKNTACCRLTPSRARLTTSRRARVPDRNFSRRDTFGLMHATVSVGSRMLWNA